MSTSLEAVGVVGAGTMGAGIAQVFLGAGFRVVMHDISEDVVKSAAERIYRGLERWQEKGQIADAGEAYRRLDLAPNLVYMQSCQWVVEAVVEDLTAKEEILRTMGRLCREETILATNTSSLSVTRLGAASGRPERTLGLHFFNPAATMRLVEVVQGLRTDPAVVQAALDLCERLGKVSVLAKDRPGFIANRVLGPMLNEAICAVEEGLGSPEDIDRVMKLGMNHPMGPLELADFIGLDVVLAMLEVLHRELGDPKYRPCPLLRKHVEAGWLGRKTRRGFYAYDGE